jgi:general stress protein 26
VLSHEKITISTRSITREHSIGSSALTVKKMCRRHNSAFSVVDAEAARLFKSFVSINGHLHAGTDGQKLHFFHGTDIEHWLLKTMLMVFYSKHSNVTPDRFELPRHGVTPFRYQLEPPLGLYLPTKTDANKITSFRMEPAATVSLITRHDLVCGVNVTLGGLALTLLIDGYESDFISLSETHTYRPTNLLFFRQEQVYALTFVFAQGSKRDIWFSHGDPAAMIPSN